MKLKPLNLLLLPIILISAINAYASDPSSSNSNFFDQRYRGWIWFEEDIKKQEKQKQNEEALKRIKEKSGRAKAKEEIEQFSKELEELKYMMIRYPENIEHAKAYKEKELIMMNNAIKLADTTRRMNFLYPELTDHIENPINLYGRKIKEEIDQKDKSKAIENLAKNSELFLFFAGSCLYCKQVEVALNDFAKKYKFKIEAISLDGEKSTYFKTHVDMNIAQNLKSKLGVEKIPTVYVITNDGKHRFELIRGAVSFSELEENAVLAEQHLRNVDKQKKQNEINNMWSLK